MWCEELIPAIIPLKSFSCKSFAVNPFKWWNGLTAKSTFVEYVFSIKDFEMVISFFIFSGDSPQSLGWVWEWDNKVPLFSKTSFGKIGIFDLFSKRFVVNANDNVNVHVHVHVIMLMLMLMLMLVLILILMLMMMLMLVVTG